MSKPGIAAPPDALAAAAASGTAGDPTGDAARGAPDDVVLSADGRRIVWILDRAARAATRGSRRSTAGGPGAATA